MVPVTPASDFENLVFHGLAHLALPDASDLYEPRYVDAAPACLRADLLLERPLIDGAYRRATNGFALQLLPVLYPDIDMFVADGHVSLRQVADGRDDEDMAKRVVQEAEVITELVRGELLLIACDYREHFVVTVLPALRRACSALEALRSEAERLCPELTGLAVAVVAALGGHGRGYPARILVGPDDDEPRQSWLWAMHEALVLAAPQQQYAPAERFALDTLRARMRGAQGCWSAVHTQWYGSLDTTRLPCVPQAADR